MMNLLTLCMMFMVLLEGMPPLARCTLSIDPKTPTTLYASVSDRGLFKSTDGGATWTTSSQGLGDAFVGKLVIDSTTPTTLYAVTGSDGIFKSIDGGAHWASILRGSTRIPVTNLAIGPQTSTTLYAGTNGGGVLKSTDGGMNWTALNGSFSTDYNRRVLALVIAPTTPTTLYAATDFSLLKSTNGGMTWTAMNRGLPALRIPPLVIDPQTPTTLYAGSIFKSTDGATSWVGLTTRGLSGADALVIDPQTPTTFYSASYMAGIFKSIDSGLNWTAVNTGLPLHFEARVEATSLYVIDLAINPTTPTILYAQAASNGGEGIFKSTNGGATWTFSNLGFPGVAHSP